MDEKVIKELSKVINQMISLGLSPMGAAPRNRDQWKGLESTRPDFPKPDVCYLTTGQVAATLGVNPKTIERWCDKGRLKAARTPGGHRKIPYSELEKLLKQRRKTADLGRCLLTTTQAARLLNVSQRTIGRWANEGRFTYKLTGGRHRRIPLTEVLRIRERRSQTRADRG